MARNTNYPYDPYVGEVPMQAVEDVMTVGSIAREVTNPINWLLWKYQYNPMTYSVFANKGININLTSRRQMAMGFRKIGKGFEKGFWSGMGSIWDAKSDFWTSKGRWVFGEDYFRGSSAKTNDLIRRSIFRQQVKAASIKSVTEGYEKAGAKLDSDMIKDINRKATNFAKTISKMTPEERLSNHTFKAMIERGFFDEMSSTIDLSLDKSSVAKKLYRKPASVAAKRLLRWGVLAPLKMYAGIGAFTTAWDVFKMVGEPIGRYLVENINRVGTAWQNRFAPEMGGKIAMSYLASGAATERQRAIEAISRSYINGRSAIGNEAQYLHG